MDIVGKDPRWEVFGPFHEYLLSAFPNVYVTSILESVELSDVPLAMLH